MRRTTSADLSAGARLRRRVDHWALRLRVMPRVVRVQRMTRKWGSCSVAGTLSLAADLDDQDRQFQDFVIVHELLHLRVANHGRLFKALMTIHVPRWKQLQEIGQQERDAVRKVASEARSRSGLVPRERLKLGLTKRQRKVLQTPSYLR